LPVILWLASAAHLPSPGVRALGEPTSPVVTEVLPYGDEQALVDAVTTKREHQADQEYDNDLDRALAVLLKRAYPSPDARDLIRRTIESLCREVESRTQSKLSNSRCNTWIDAACQTPSFESVLNDLNVIAAQSTNREQLVEVGLAAMLSATDSKMAGVLSVPEAQQITKALHARGSAAKENGVVGIDVSQWPTIMVVPGLPAAQAGLQDGDVVVRVDSRNVAKTERAPDGLKALAGPADTVVKLTVVRNGKSLAFEVRRASAAHRINSTVIDSKVISVKIPLFEGSGIARRVEKLIRKHLTDDTIGVILDLRDNLGGRAAEANAVADIFLDEKILQIFQFRNGRRIAVESTPGAVEIPLVVLTNQNTASAAEMLAIALHDNQRATVIGQPTAGILFGKDFEKLSDGRMIVFRSEPTILSPTGKDYSEDGLPPDILVDESMATGEDKILAGAVRLLNRSAPQPD
jgi:carboxyl-terminal processing protease